jgi:hypothetical protein
VIDPVVAASFDAMEAQIELLRVQVIGVRQRLQALAESQAPRVEHSLPDRCNGIAEHRCGLRDEGARIPCGNLREPGKWQCRGCREVTIDGISDLN